VNSSLWQRNQSLNQRNLGVVDQEGDGSPEIVQFRTKISVENDYVLTVFDAIACPCSPEIVWFGMLCWCPWWVCLVRYVYADTKFMRRRFWLVGLLLICMMAILWLICMWNVSFWIVGAKCLTKLLRGMWFLLPIFANLWSVGGCHRRVGLGNSILVGWKVAILKLIKNSIYLK
jgi:hypothetical protein